MSVPGTFRTFQSRRRAGRRSHAPDVTFAKSSRSSRLSAREHSGTPPAIRLRRGTRTPMDIARPERAQQLRRRRIVWGGAAIVVLAAGSLALARLEPAAPSVEGGTLWIDSVKRGEMLREVRGQGTLVPEREQWISADSAGQVVQVVAASRRPVTADTVILQMTNPELAQQAQEAQSQLATAEADLRVLEAQLATTLLNQEGGGRRPRRAARRSAAAGGGQRAAARREADPRHHAQAVAPARRRADEAAAARGSSVWHAPARVQRGADRRPPLASSSSCARCSGCARSR